MISVLHEAIVEMLRDAPSALPGLLKAAGADFLAEFGTEYGTGGGPGLAPHLQGPVEVRIGESQLNDRVAVERACDLLVEWVVDGVCVACVVVEVQLRRDESKRWVWPTYWTVTACRRRCRTLGLPENKCFAAAAAGGPSRGLRPHSLGRRSAATARSVAPGALAS